MTNTTSLDIDLSFASLVFSLVVVVVAIVLSSVSWKRSGFSVAIGRLEALRLLIIFFVVVLLHQPEWTTEFQPETKPRLAIYYDQSPSMDTLDVERESGPASGAVSRKASIQRLLDKQSWSALMQEFDLVIEPIAASRGEVDSAMGQPTDRSLLTNLSIPLTASVKNHEGLAGVVLISDGDWNDGPSPVDAASKLRSLRIPVFTITAGSTRKLPDIELVNADVPTFGTVEKPIRIPLTLDSSLSREAIASVRLLVDGMEAESLDLRVAPMARTSDALVWKPDTVGDFELSIEVPVQKGELLSDNNRLSFPISIRREQLKVLVVESLPRWEYRYLRNALSRDPGVEVSCLLFHPGLDKVGGGSQDYLKVFPEELEDLAKFDVVFLGDVGLDDSQLTEEQCELIRGLVEYQASGLVFLPGFQGRQFSLIESELGDLYPVIMDEEQPEGWGSRVPGHFELTQRGRSSLLTKLANTAEENFGVWESLPGFQWYAPVIRAKAGAEILAVHQDISNQSGRLPLLVTRPFGAGKVLFMGTDGAWRWRKGVEDKYHYRFWGQVVRWMAYQRNMAKGESMRLFYAPDQPELRQTLTLNAHVMDSVGEPLQSGEVTAMITSPNGNIDTIRLSAEGERWGVFRGRYETVEPGQHAVLLSCKETQSVLNASFFVQGNLSEPVGRPARPAVLQEISRISRGRNVAASELDKLMDSILDLPKPEPKIRRVQLWSHPFVAGMMLLLLTLFWILRKAAGLI